MDSESGHYAIFRIVNSAKKLSKVVILRKNTENTEIKRHKTT